MPSLLPGRTLAATLMIGGALILSTGAAAEDRRDVRGDACYRIGSGITEAQAQKTATELARLAAVSSARVDVFGESNVVDMLLDSQRVTTLATGALYDGKVESTDRRGDEICVVVSGYVRMEEVALLAEEFRRQAEEDRWRRGIEGKSNTAPRHASDSCKAEREARVYLEEDLGGERSRDQIVEALTERAVQEGIRQAFGVKIRSRGRLDLDSSATPSDMERFVQRIVSSSGGFALYAVHPPFTRELADGRTLKLFVDVNVCDPLVPPRPTIAVGQVLSSKGEPLLYLADALAARFSGPDSPFVVSSDGPDYADLVLDGRVNQVRVTDLTIPDGQVPGLPGGVYKRAMADMTLNAVHQVEGWKLTEKVEDNQLFPGHRDAREIGEVVAKRVIDRAIRRLRERLTAEAAGGAVPQHTDQAPARPAKSTGALPDF